MARESNPRQGTRHRPPPQALAGLVIQRWAHGGDGVASADGKVVFVPGVVPGDVVDVVVVEDHPRWARAAVERVVAPSPERVTPPCRVQARCGGCPWMAGSAAAQAASRRAILEAEVGKRLGPGVAVALAPDVSPPLGYRQRVRLTWRGAALGYLQKGTHALVDIGGACPIADPRIAAALPALAAHVAARGGAGKATLLAGEDGVAGWLEPEGGPPEVWGREAVTVRLGAFRQALRAGSFAQANAAVTGAILDDLTALFRAAGPGHAVELFAGSGTLTQALWAAGWRVSAYELDGAARAGFEATRAAAGGVGTWSACDLATGLVHPAPAPMDAIVLDPPRTGAAALMPWVRASAARLVVYVACDLATGLRDLALLAADGRWRVERATGWDMFPHSGHQEVVAIARRCTP